MSQLPRPFDLKRTQGVRFIFLQFVFDNVVDAAAARAFVELGAEFGDRFGRPGGDDFHLSCVGVADRTAKGEFGGLAVHEPTKSDALHSALYEKVNNHERTVSQSYTVTRNRTPVGRKQTTCAVRFCVCLTEMRS